MQMKGMETCPLFLRGIYMKTDQEIRYCTVEGISAEHQIKLQFCRRCTGKTYLECDHSLCEHKGVLNNGKEENT